MNAPAPVGALDRRDIPGLEGFYAASRDGRIYSIRRRKWLAPALARGYQVVTIAIRGRKQKVCKVHRLVALAWLPNPAGLPQINHIDGCKTNNAVENLEWADNRRQQLHARALGLVKVTPAMRAASSRNIRKASVQARRLTMEQAREVRASSDSCAVAARKYGVTAGAIHQIRRGKSYAE